MPAASAHPDAESCQCASTSGYLRPWNTTQLADGAAGMRTSSPRVESYFSPIAPSEASGGGEGGGLPRSYSLTPTPQPRSQARRQSIALQSSSSHQMPLSMPVRGGALAPSSPLRRTQRQAVQPLSSSPEPWSIASTKSLPPRVLGSSMARTPHPLPLAIGPDAVPSCSATSSAQSDRRRSVAHERYPPLSSIIESSGIRELLEERFKVMPSPHVPATAAPLDMASSPYAAIGPVPASARPGLMSMLGTSASTPHFANSTTGRLATVPPRPTAGANENDSHGRASVPRSASNSSLDSIFSTTSSLISSSSAQSSYAYIFDSARPAAPGSPRRHKASAFCSPHQPSALSAAARRQSLDNVLVGDGPLLFGSMIAHSICSRQEGRGSSEGSPLLSDESASAETLGGDHVSLRPDRRPTPLLLASEMRANLGMSSYLFLGNVLQAVISMSRTASSGHLGRTELAAIGLAHMVITLTGYSFSFSVLSCLETFASQAFTSTRPQLVGAYVVRAIQIQWLLGLVMGSLWFSCGPLLAKITHGSSPEVITAAVTYLRWYFVPFMVFSNAMCVKQALYAQGITYPLPFLTLLGAAVTIGAQYLLVFSPYFQLGIRGIALGSGISFACMLLAALWVVRRHNVARIWGGFAVRAPWRPFIALMPSCLALSLFSTGTSELITVAATQLGPDALPVQSVLTALCGVFVVVFSGLGTSALNRLGNHIGRRAPRAAKISACSSVLIATTSISLGAAAILCAPEAVIRIFTNDTSIVQDTAEIIGIAALAFAAQTLAFVVSQLLSAQGRQPLAAKIKFIALYAIAVPLGYYWTVVSDHGLAGLWRAVAVGQAFVSRRQLPNHQLRSNTVDGVCDAGVKQLSGYLDTAEDRHFFYWFFEAQMKPKGASAPLVVWLNGGPGCSSMVGALAELGPCQVTPDGQGTEPNPYGWNQYANLLFVDQPTNVGFSYGTPVSDTAAAAEDIVALLLLFYETYPEYDNSDLHIFGESYAGHYIPAIGAAILDHNSRSDETHQRTLPLASVGIGNGFINPRNELKYLSKMACNSTYPSTLPQEICDEMDVDYQFCAKKIDACYSTNKASLCTNAKDYCSTAVQSQYYSQDIAMNPYDVRSKCTKPPLCYDAIYMATEFLNSTEVQQALHAQETNFVACSNDVASAFAKKFDVFRSFDGDLAKILEAGIRALIYNGDADWICNWYGVKSTLMEMDWSGQEEFNRAVDQPWLADGEGVGEVRTGNNLTFIRVFESGHMVPHDQPKVALDMLAHWITYREFTTA
ncbi:hypothetical protein GGF46_000184 [Coemansia sp. RSA 552]|nr:hypothetical protein GGF46_000184 [Coemansia sp. RSA 552]